jgi:tripartite-type tricarboxylate transporter receptor subunit TctC
VNWYGLVAPKGTPRQIISKVNKDVVAVLKMPDVVDVLAQNGMVPLPSTAENFGIFLREEIKKWGKVVRDSNIRVD